MERVCALEESIIGLPQEGGELLRLEFLEQVMFDDV
jgi:hypothetical protein